MYYTGLDPTTGKAVYVPKGERERKLQRALLQYFKPENYSLVREALEKAGREDLIGNDPDCLIPSQPPKVTTNAKSRDGHHAKGKRTASTGRDGPRPATAGGYRPHRKTAKRRGRND
jgi:hypothetical protein